MNPVNSKIQKIKKSFNPQLLLTADSAYTETHSHDTLEESSSRGNLHQPFILNKPTSIEMQKEVMSDRDALLEKLFNMQDKVQRQERSKTFYLKELNRRELYHQQQLNKIERQHLNRVDCLERLLQIEVDKNIYLESQFNRLVRRNEDKENTQTRRNQLKKLTMGQLSQLVNFIQEELDSRNKSRQLYDSKRKSDYDKKNQCLTPRRVYECLMLTEDIALMSKQQEVIKYL